MSMLARLAFVVVVSLMLLVGCGGDGAVGCDECLAEQSQAIDPGGCAPYCESDEPPLSLRLRGSWYGTAQMWAEGSIRASRPQTVLSTTDGPTAFVTSICPAATTTHEFTGEGIRAMWQGSVSCTSVYAYGCEGSLTVTRSSFTVFDDGVANVDSWGTWSGCGRTVEARLFFSGPRTSP